METAINLVCSLFLFNFPSSLSRRGSYYYDFSIVDRVTDLGYPIETHSNVQTEDGYLIDLFRIPNGKTTKKKVDKPVVLLMHGLFASSAAWVLLGEKKGLPFVLAERNYDVWLGNIRGNSHGRKHVSMNPDKDPEFWDYSFHENGLYDLPAVMSHIRNVTGTKKMSYICHSQGCAMLYVLTSKKPEYNAYFNVVINLAPAIYILRQSTMSPSEISQLFITLKILAETLRFHEIGPQVKEAFCRKDSTTKEECYDMAFKVISFLGDDLSLMDKDVFERFFGMMFDSSSFRQIMHFLQGASKADFCEYDFGVDKNLVKYSSKFPSRYNLKNCTAAAAIFYGKRDILSTPANDEKLIKRLPNVIFSKMYDITHDGFLTTNDPDLNKQILRILKQISLI